MHTDKALTSNVRTLMFGERKPIVVFYTESSAGTAPKPGSRLFAFNVCHNNTVGPRTAAAILHSNHANTVIDDQPGGKHHGHHAQRSRPALARKWSLWPLDMGVLLSREDSAPFSTSFGITL